MKNLGLLRHKFLYGLIEKKGVQLARLGSPCAWDVHLGSLDTRSNIVSAGAGGDISFEIELSHATGAKIILLDPSPTGCRTIEQTPSALLKGIRFLPYGLTSESGVKQFALPANSAEGSYAFDQGLRETVSFECRSLLDLMRENSMQRVDLLKIDIEGFEWEVLHQMLKQRLDVRQICVEFHPMHGRFRSGLQRYVMLLRMRLCGYQLVSHHGTGDHTFIRADCV